MAGEAKNAAIQEAAIDEIEMDFSEMMESDARTRFAKSAN